MTDLGRIIEPGNGPAHRAADDGSSRPQIASRTRWALVALVLLLWGYACSQIDPSRSGPSGLVRELPVTWWLALALLIALMLDTLSSAGRGRLYAVAVTVALLAVLQGTIIVTEAAPRFFEAYTISGFSAELAPNGTPLTKLDARMSWPAFFAAIGFLSRVTGVHTTWFISWWPMFMNALYLLPLHAITKKFLVTRRARLGALWLFLASNWIGQDYFSPQSLAFFLYLVIVAVALRFFSTQKVRSHKVDLTVAKLVANLPGTRTLETRESAATIDVSGIPSIASDPDGENLPQRVQLGLYAVLLVMAAAVVVTHQLTPVALVIVFFLLAVIGRTRLTSLWATVVVASLSWLSFEAVDYWSYHLREIFGDVGNVQSSVARGVGGHYYHSDAGRLLVNDVRIGIVTVLWAAALWTFVTRVRARPALIVPFICAFAPIALIGAQSYGGEILLRVALFGTPFCALLCAAGIDRAPSSRARPLGSLIFFGVLLLSLLVFPIARYGNESFESVAAGDLRATEWLYGNIPTGSRIIAINGDSPLSLAPPGSYRYVRIGGLALEPENTAQYLSTLRDDSWFILTQTQVRWASDYLGWPTSWASDLERTIATSPGAELVFSNSTAYVYKISRGNR